MGWNESPLEAYLALSTVLTSKDEILQIICSIRQFFNVTIDNHNPHYDCIHGGSAKSILKTREEKWVTDISNR